MKNDTIKYFEKMLRKHEHSLKHAQNEIQVNNINLKIKYTKDAIDALNKYKDY